MGRFQVLGRELLPPEGAAVTHILAIVGAVAICVFAVAVLAFVVMYVLANAMSDKG